MDKDQFPALSMILSQNKVEAGGAYYSLDLKQPGTGKVPKLTLKQIEKIYLSKFKDMESLVGKEQAYDYFPGIEPLSYKQGIFTFSHREESLVIAIAINSLSEYLGYPVDQAETFYNPDFQRDLRNIQKRGKS